MIRPVILTGVRANNDIHIGNYFGAILPIVDMAKKHADEYDINLFIPDLHSFTTPIDHSQLYGSIMNNARVYAAAGLPLDDESIYLYRQSYVSAHSELTVILNNFVGFGEMERMTQFKDKSRKASRALTQGDAAEGTDGPARDRVSVGLFDYPVLMAADILLYNSTYVPVGDDQTQHLEITRDIAERMNRKFGNLFVVPKPVSEQHQFFGNEQGLRIKDLINPAKKMSKSDESGKGVIFLNDEPQAAYKKVMSATTDSLARINYDKENQPGIANLLEILALVRQDAGLDITLADIVDEFSGRERYGDFKKIVASEVADFLSRFQSRLAKIDDVAILAKLASSEAAMNIIANETLRRVQIAVGLRKDEDEA